MCHLSFRFLLDKNNFLQFTELAPKTCRTSREFLSLWISRAPNDFIGVNRCVRGISVSVQRSQPASPRRHVDQVMSQDFGNKVDSKDRYVLDPHLIYVIVIFAHLSLDRGDCHVHFSLDRSDCEHFFLLKQTILVGGWW